MKKFLLIPALALMILSQIACCDLSTPIELQSPDGKVAININFDETGSLSYSVLKDKKDVILPSNLAIDFEKGMFSKNLEIIGLEKNSVDEIYELVVGKDKEARNHYNEVIIELSEKVETGRNLNLILRAYNDGVAFRYQIPESGGMDEFKILDEFSEFHFPDSNQCWALHLKSFNSNYESEFENISVNEIKPDTFIGLPLTVQIENGHFVLISEANLTDYAGMYLEGKSENESTVVSRLSPLPDSSGVCIVGTAPHYSPWRVIMIADNPGDLIESHLITNLNDPIEIEDPSWIKPGKVAWPWWSGRVVKDVDFVGGMNTETQKYYIDFAEEFRLEYLLIDALWYGAHKDPNQDITTTVPEIDMPEIIAYAKERNVDVLIWLNWENTNKQMDEAFALYEKWGIKGVKIDYMNRDDQEMVNFYQTVVKKAAEHHLLVDFHGAYKQTGFRRKYPNFITSEGILGLEFTKWSERVTAEHNVTIPFTRMVVGPMDYTPGAFQNVTKEGFVSQKISPMAVGTRAHHLAMFVVYESPLQMVSDHPASYKGEIGSEFLKIVPSTWHQTNVIAGEIGDYIAIARKYNNDWFIGVMTDDNSRKLNLSLDFLSDSNYTAHIYQDAPDSESNPKHIIEYTKTVSSTDTLMANMASSGGFVVHLALEK